MHTEWFEDIFGDGWRDPSEDIQRLAVYILAAIGSAFGVVSTGYGLYEIVVRRADLSVTLALALAGPALAYPCLKFLKRESRHWDFSYIDAEIVITSGFMLGFAFLFIGLLGAELGVLAVFFLFGCVAVGCAILLLSLIGGFICAYWHKLPGTKQVMRDILIEERYAVDDKLQKIPNHPSPHEDGYTPCVRVRTPNGHYVELTCTQAAYQLAKPGSRGTAQLIAYRMMAFERNA